MAPFDGTAFVVGRSQVVQFDGGDDGWFCFGGGGGGDHDGGGERRYDMVGVQYNINNNTNVNHDGSVNLALPPTQFCIKNFPSFV